jgi:hypothetical protein
MNTQYAIIGGTTKAATTSLFEYLSNHPEVCGSMYKESRFFLDDDYPLEKKISFGDSRQYNILFKNCLDKNTYLEATPDYLYSQGSAQRIKQLLPDAKLIFILREPISRLVSWYKFAQQNNLLSFQVSFDEFIAMQQKPLPGYTKQQHLMALEQGKYAQYLRPYYEAFGSQNIHILFYEDISKNQLESVKGVCDFLGIDEEFYETYNFKIHNKTKSVKSQAFHNLYRSTRQRFRKLIPKSTFFGKWLRGKHKESLEPLYLKINEEKQNAGFIISTSMQVFLRSYYTGQKEALKNLFDNEIPW